MKTNNNRFVLGLILAAVLAFPVGVVGQSYTVSNTTLSSAINSSQTTLVVASASASSGSSFGAPAAGQCLFVDGELMRIVSVASTTFTVARSAYSPAAHPANAIVWTGPCGTAFKQGDPAVGAFLNNTNNSCSTQPAPWINVASGNIWWCNRTNNRWSGTSYLPFTYNSVPIAQ